ncbi:sorbitol dehydrogenase [Thozetella sp. PMI_491]|nr:sorbitol dehydrogenase [Thozetella sp. PMI_491]
MATTTVQASVLHGTRDLRLESRTIDAPGPDEVQVSVRSTGICGSDQHYFHHYRNGDILVREPLVLGHESAGVVEAVGANVAAAGTFQVGDRVALEVGEPCSECALCKAGRYNLCPGMRFRSSAKAFPHFQGTLQGRVNQAAKWCYKLPTNVSLDEGALLEPLSVAIHGVRRARMDAGAKVLVIGAGAVGLLAAAMLRVEKASRITIADIEGRRVQFATKNGFADVAVEVPRTRAKSDAIEDKLAHAQETAKVLMADGEQFDYVFECTGVESCVQSAIYSTTPGGKVMLIGMGTPIQTLPMSAAALREVDLVGVFRYANTYPYGLELLANKEKNGLPDVSKLATHHFKGLDKVPEAFAMAGKPVDDDGNLVLKVVIEA